MFDVTPERERPGEPAARGTGACPQPFPLHRPAPLAAAARRAQLSYRRARDLPGALPGLLSQPTANILPKLAEGEARCEAARRAGAAEYRPARHLQILAALLAETAAAQAQAQAQAAARDQPKASGSSALRLATKAASASSIAGSRAGCT